MKALSRLPIFAALALALPAFAGPSCPPPGAGGESANWGADYRERVKDIFDAVKAAAGVTQDVVLININDLKGSRNAGSRLVNGTPLGALPKGTEGLQTDAVFYTFGVLELACNQAQLAFFMAHEMRHIKRGPDGKTHFDQVSACRQKILKGWIDGADISSFYPSSKTGNPALDDAAEKTGNAAVLAKFEKEKGEETARACVKPVENEADAFAFALTGRADFPYKVQSSPDNPDPSRDERVRAFEKAEKWLDAIGENQSDPGHGTAADRAVEARRVANEEAVRLHQAREEQLLQSIQPNY